MAFNRQVSLVIGEGQAESAKQTGKEIGNLDIEFDITRSRTFEENTAEFSVYNLATTTRQTLMEKGAAVILTLGYEDEGTGVAFIGAISDIKETEQGGDIKTTFQAVTAGGNNSIDTVYVSLGYSKGALVSEIIQQIATALGLAVYGIDQAKVTLNNGFTFSGSARQALKRCEWFLAINSVKMMVDNGELILFGTDGKESRFDVGILDYTSGLISAKPLVSDKPGQDAKKRIEVQSLIVPKIRPNSLIKIDGDYVQGIYIVDKVQFKGSNFGDEFDNIMELVE